MEKFKAYMLKEGNITEKEYEKMLYKLYMKLGYMVEALHHYSKSNKY